MHHNGVIKTTINWPTNVRQIVVSFKAQKLIFMKVLQNLWSFTHTHTPIRQVLWNSFFFFFLLSSSLSLSPIFFPYLLILNFPFYFKKDKVISTFVVYVLFTLGTFFIWFQTESLLQNYINFQLEFCNSTKVSTNTYI